MERAGRRRLADQLAGFGGRERAVQPEHLQERQPHRMGDRPQLPGSVRWRGSSDSRLLAGSAAAGSAGSRDRRRPPVGRGVRSPRRVRSRIVEGRRPAHRIGNAGLRGGA